MKNGKSLTVERARELLEYDPETGVLRWRRDVYRTKIKSGQEAGCARKDGRRVVCVDGRLMYVYRVAWLLAYGSWPADQIDHINGDQSDNRLINLRQACNSINGQNKRKAFRTSKTGLLGACPASCPGESGRFVANIGIGGRTKNLGYFDTPEEAHEAYVRKKREIHPGCTI
jgi:hypothetical protein